MRYFVVLFLIAMLLPAVPSTAQPDDATMLPRFGEGAAIISRPNHGDYNFMPSMTDDARYVFSIGDIFEPDTVYRWDISGMGNDVIAPVPDELDISRYLYPGRNNTARLLIVEPYMIVQVDNHLLKIDIEAFTILDSVQIDGWEAAYDVDIAQHDNHIAAAYMNGIAIWNIETGERAVLEFDMSPSQTASFSQGWIFTLRDFNGPTETLICTPDISTCYNEPFNGWFSMEVDGVLIFGNTSYISYDRDIEVSYFTFDEGLRPAEPIFEQFAEGEPVPYQITGDGKYVLAMTPNENPGRQDGGAWVSPRYQGLYAIDGDEELADVHSWMPFGDHFFAGWLSLWDAESQKTVDSFSFNELVGRIDCTPFFNCALDGYNHGAYPVQVTDTALLHVTGYNAIVVSIEYQRVDDLMTVGKPVFSTNYGGDARTEFTTDGDAILVVGYDSVNRIDLSGETQDFDLTPYLGEGSSFRINMLVREEDVFLQTASHLLQLGLPELTLIDAVEVDNPIDVQYGYGSPYGSTRLVEQNGAVGALFDDVVLVWQDDGAAEYDIGEFGIALYAAENGWIIHHVAAEEWHHSLLDCDFILSDCLTIEIERPVYNVFEDGRIMIGPPVFGHEDKMPPDIWRIVDGELVPALSIIDLPDDRFTPVATFGNAVLVDAPDAWNTDYENVYQVWSLSENQPVTRLTFSDTNYGVGWRAVDDYLVLSQGGLLTFLHLPDGRFRRWRIPVGGDTAEAIQGFDIAGDHILIRTRSGITVYELTQ